MASCLNCKREIDHHKMDTSIFCTQSCCQDYTGYEKRINYYASYFKLYRYFNERRIRYKNICNKLNKKFCVSRRIMYMRFKGKNTSAQKAITQMLQ